jgi:hypothetical protein
MGFMNQNLNKSIETLTCLERVYVIYIMDLLTFKSVVPELNDYAKQFIILLKYVININNNILISELKPNLDSILVTYITDLSDLLHNSLNINNTNCFQKYQNLVIANKNITKIVKNYNQYGEIICYELDNLKELLLQL